MAAFFMVKELLAIRTCCVIAERSSFASVLSSASLSSLNEAPQSLRILAMISSIRSSVEEGTG